MAVTKTQALAAYNQIYKTEYATVTDLGKALADKALKDAWIRSKRDLAERAAKDETIT